MLRPGGLAAVTVPAWLPERVCWALSREYHEVPGGHVRIFTRAELTAKLAGAGLEVTGSHHAHGLHSPYWWLKCAVGVHDDAQPRRPRLPPAACLGHHAPPRAHPAQRGGAQSAHRQEPRRLREKDFHPERARGSRCGTLSPGARPGRRPRTACCGPPARSRRRSGRTARSAGRTGTSTRGTTWSARWRSAPAGSPGRRGAPTSWLRDTQRPDGSWPRTTGGPGAASAAAVADQAAESHHAAYVAVGVWHEFLVTGDRRVHRGDVAGGARRDRLGARAAGAARRGGLGARRGRGAR